MYHLHLTRNLRSLAFVLVAVIGVVVFRVLVRRRERQAAVLRAQRDREET